MAEPRQLHFHALGPSGFIRIAYAEWGRLDAARTVVCVHSLTRNGRDFEHLARALSRKGFRVVAPDLPGRGRSDWLRPTLHYYGNAVYLSVMAALIARLGVEKVDWVGTSMGGYIGMEMAVQSGSPVRRLVLNDFGARVPAAALRRIGAVASTCRAEFETVDEVEAHLRQAFAGFGRLTDAQWRHLAQHSFQRMHDGKLRLNHDPAIVAPFAWPFVADFVLWHLWDKISCPVLVLRGAGSDFLLPEVASEMQRRGMAASRGRVEAAEIPGCGHTPALMSSHEIEIIANFLLDAGSVTEYGTQAAGHER